MNQKSELSMLNDLLDTVNNPNIPGMEAPAAKPKPKMKTEPKPARPTAPAAPAEAPTPTPTPTPAPAAATPTPAPAARVDRLFFTGKLKSGKDFASAAAGAKIFGFADPIYALARHFFKIPVSSAEKTAPGIREFLQTVGQWGRGHIDEAYPLTVHRAIFVELVRDPRFAGRVEFPEVAWDTFGNNPSIWLDACVARAEAFQAANPGARVAVTNCRFEIEFTRLQSLGWQHWHSVCSNKTWAARLAKSGLTPDSSTVKDTSERLAAGLDASVIKQVSEHPHGPKLRAIWSDTEKSPSGRLHSVESFVAAIGGAL